MTYKSKPKMPEWNSSDETIAQFWDTHDIVDYWDELEVAKDVKFIKPQSLGWKEIFMYAILDLHLQNERLTKGTYLLSL